MVEFTWYGPGYKYPKLPAGSVTVWVGNDKQGIPIYQLLVPTGDAQAIVEEGDKINIWSNGFLITPRAKGTRVIHGDSVRRIRAAAQAKEERRGV